MVVHKQSEIHAKEIEKFIKQNNLHFIRNNERFRTKLKMNKKQLSLAIRHLERTGYLKPWNKKIYQRSHT